MPQCLQALSCFLHDLANRGKSSTGWFYGFKLNILIKNLGKIINLKVTSGNVHDVSIFEALTLELKGVLLGDKGYLSKAKTEILAARGLKLLTPVRKSMKSAKPKIQQEKSYYS